MDKTPSAKPDTALKDLVERSLETAPQGELFSPLLDQLMALSQADFSRFATSAARQGQERALPILVALTASPSLAPFAAEALGLIKSREAAVYLAELAETSESKQVKKAAARGLHKLHSVGIQPGFAKPDLVRTPEDTSSARQARSKAWASSIDGGGSRFLFMTIAEPLGGHRNLVFLMMNDRDGIRETRVSHAESNEDASSRVETVATQSKLPHVELPADYARHLIKDGREKARAAGHSLPVDYMVWKEAIGEPQEEWEHPPIYRELNSAQILMEPGLLEESARLLDLGEFRNWILGTQEMRPYAEELEQSRLGVIVLPGPAQAEREERVLEKALEELLGKDGTAGYKHRLEEMSYVLLHTGREREAKSALAAALAMDQDSRHGSLYLPGSRATDRMLGERTPLARHPFFRRLMVESLNVALGQISKGRTLLVGGSRV
ncbi:MAG: hypothetical protein Q7R39_20715 [Dehalococcoidia bacterium]|nr:hypothetical protein [Dehalococcoidia bacterium]